MSRDSYGCTGVLITVALIVAFMEVLKWVGIGALAIAAIALIVFIGRTISSKVEESSAERAARKEREQLEAAQYKLDEERKRVELENARRGYERMTYNSYKSALEYSQYKDKLEEATALINKMINDKDGNHRQKIIPFFDRYLPLMTDALKADPEEAPVSNEMINIFTETVRSFFNDLYQYDDVIETNQKILEKMAAMEGLADNSDASFSVDSKQ